jgi:hypothetical protein
MQNKSTIDKEDAQDYLDAYYNAEAIVLGMEQYVENSNN